MPRPLFRFICIAALTFGLVPRLARGGGLFESYIDFRRMVAESEVIAIARFAGEWNDDQKDHNVELELTRIIKGDLKPGKYNVGRHGGPQLERDTTEFVIFFGKGLRWRFAAVPLSDQNQLADGVLRVEGGIVCPNVVTLAQIETFVKDYRLAYTIRGPLCFPKRGQAVWEPSSLEIEVHFDAIGTYATVQGLPELKGFTGNPSVSVGYARTGGGHFGLGFGNSRSTGGIIITYSRDPDMPLQICGQIESVDLNTGSIRAKFFVAEPTLLTRQDFEDYLSDPRKGRSCYTVNITCARFAGEEKGRVLTLTLFTRTYFGGVPNAPGELIGWVETPLELRSLPGISLPKDDSNLVRWTSAKLPSGEELTLQSSVERLGVSPDLLDWTFEEKLLHGLLVGDISGRILVRTGETEHEVTTFTASLRDVKHATLDPSRAQRSITAVEPDAWEEMIKEDRDPFGERADWERDRWYRMRRWAAFVMCVVIVAGLAGWWIWGGKRKAPTLQAERPRRRYLRKQGSNRL